MSDRFVLKMNGALCRLTMAGISWLTSDADRDCIADVTKTLENGGETLRATAHRRVLRVTGPRSLIVKHFAPRGLAATLKAWMRPSPAAGEWSALRKAVQLGVPVARPVAVGWRRAGLRRESFLVTEAIGDGITVSSCLFGNRRLPTAPRRAVLQAAALVLRRMHDAGIFHKDLHLDNLIASIGAGDPAVYLIDFQRMGFHRSLKPRLRERNLAMLNGGCIAAARADRLRFLKYYLGTGAPRAGERRALAVRLDETGRRHRRRIRRSRQRRCLAENREFAKIRLGEFAGMVRRDRYDFVNRAWTEPERCFVRSTLVASSEERDLGRIDMSERSFHIARYRRPGLALGGAGSWIAPRARRAWLAANTAVMSGLAMGTPLAWLEWRRGPVLIDSYVISESAKGADLAETFVGRARDFPVKRRLIDDFARYVARLHDCDLAIRRLTGKEVIVSGNGSRFAFALIDFTGVTSGAVSRQDRIEQLNALAETFPSSGGISKTDRLRFLRAYLGVRFDREWKTFSRGPRP